MATPIASISPIATPVRRIKSARAGASGGGCRAGRTATDEDFTQAPYVLKASPAVWRQVLGGDLEPVGAVMTGLLDLSRGSLIGLAPWVGAAKELLSAACRVETTYPEGWS